MIILDTNVISEQSRPAPEPKVEQWLSLQDGLHVYRASMTEAQLRYSLPIIRNGMRLAATVDAVDCILRENLFIAIIDRMANRDRSNTYQVIDEIFRAMNTPVASAPRPS